MKVGRLWDICNFQVLTPERCRAYWCLWEQAVGRECSVDAVVDTPESHNRNRPVTPRAGEDLTCLHRGALLRNEPCRLCGDRERLEGVFACDLHEECSLQRFKAGTRSAPQVCAKCPDRLPYVKINADVHGFGDACVTAWISEGAKHGPVRVVHKASGAKREFLEMLGQDVTEDDTNAVCTFEAYTAELRDSGNPPRYLQRGRYLGIETEPKRPALVLESAAQAWANDTLAQSARNVLLFPHTMWGSREWPPAYWMELHDLLRHDGFTPWIVSDIADVRYAHLNGVAGATWPRVAALMLAAEMVIGNDSGPAHLAGTLDKPTLVLLGPSQPSMFVQYKSVRCLSATREECSCSGCYFHPPFNSAVCEHGCVALSHLTPNIVLEAVRETATA